MEITFNTNIIQHPDTTLAHIIHELKLPGSPNVCLSHVDVAYTDGSFDANLGIASSGVMYMSRGTTPKLISQTFLTPTDFGSHDSEIGAMVIAINYAIQHQAENLIIMSDIVKDTTIPEELGQLLKNLPNINIDFIYTTSHTDTKNNIVHTLINRQRSLLESVLSENQLINQAVKKTAFVPTLAESKSDSQYKKIMMAILNIMPDFSTFVKENIKSNNRIDKDLVVQKYRSYTDYYALNIKKIYQTDQGSTDIHAVTIINAAKRIETALYEKLNIARKHENDLALKALLAKIQTPES